MKQEFESGGRGGGRYIESTGRYQEVKGKVTDQTRVIKRAKTQWSSPEKESQIRRCIVYHVYMYMEKNNNESIQSAFHSHLPTPYQKIQKCKSNKNDPPQNINAKKIGECRTTRDGEMEQKESIEEEGEHSLS